MHFKRLRNIISPSANSIRMKTGNILNNHIKNEIMWQHIFNWLDFSKIHLSFPLILILLSL